MPYKLEMKHRLINIDSSHRCPLECPKCQRQAIRSRGFKVPGRDMPWKDFIKIAEFFKKGLIFCGQISDPIFHPKFIEMLKYGYDHHIPIYINTAASQKPIKWYEKAFDANPKAYWIFGVDGLPKDSHKYRIHQDGPKLFEVMKIGVKRGLYIRWQYIVFNYNENNIEEARQIAKDNDIHFDLILSGRWGIEDKYKPKNPKHYLNSVQNPTSQKLLVRDLYKEYFKNEN
jgi:MoaA/NifB/PqqE/SkfB family radical SAM enzyme